MPDKELHTYTIRWWTGNYPDEGCTIPPYEFITIGYRDRENHGLNEENLSIFNGTHSQENKQEFVQMYGTYDKLLCATVKAASIPDAWGLVYNHFPDCEEDSCFLQRI